MNVWHPKPGGISVYYRSETNGGGLTFGREYVDQCQKLFPGRVFQRCFEWCSGAGFIGFSLMDFGICQNLFFTDVYRPAIECIETTIDNNPNLKDKVKGRVCGMIQSIPEQLKFDLVVSNPPHFNNGPIDFHGNRINVDHDWAVHKEFFLNISRYLAPGAEILLQENQCGSQQMDKTWQPWIEQGGLEVIGCYASDNWYQKDEHTSIYYLHARLKN